MLNQTENEGMQARAKRCAAAAIMLVPGTMLALVLNLAATGCYHTPVGVSELDQGPAPRRIPSPRRDEEACCYEDTLTGGQIFSMYCSYCHNAPSLSERNFANFKNVATHMRVRANLTGKEYAKLMEFLQRIHDVPPPNPPPPPSPKRLIFSQQMQELREEVAPPPRQKGPELLPGKDVPGKDIPGKGVPGKDAPVKDVSRKDLPGKDVPVKTVPGRDVPVKILPGKVVPGEDLPRQDVPIKIVPGKVVPGEDLPRQDVPIRIVPGRILSGRDVPGTEAKEAPPGNDGAAPAAFPDGGTDQGPTLPPPGSGLPRSSGTRRFFDPSTFGNLDGSISP
jgi:hypothetical protein